MLVTAARYIAGDECYQLLPKQTTTQSHVPGSVIHMTIDQPSNWLLGAGPVRMPWGTTDRAIVG